MGNKISLMEALSVEEIGQFVAGLGSKYESYVDAITDNAVDGELLASLANDEEMMETLECLEIKNFLHQRVLLKEWKKAVDVNNTKLQAEQGLHIGREIETPTTAVASEEEETDHVNVLLDDLTTSTHNHNHEPINKPTTLAGTSGHEPMDSNHDNDDTENNADNDIDKDSGIISPPAALVQALQALELAEDNPELTVESIELQPYRTVATRAMEDLHGRYGGVDLVSLQSSQGHNCLCAVQSNAQAARMHVSDDSLLRSVVLESNDDYVGLDAPEHISKTYGITGFARYYGHVVKMGNLRVGMVSVIIEESKLENTTDEEKQLILKLLAAEAERQLQRRKVLVERNQSSERDTEVLKTQQKQQPAASTVDPVDQVVLPGYGPLHPVLASQIESRMELYPYPQSDTEVQVRTSVELPYFANIQNLATEEDERAHIPPSFYDALDQFPLVKMPVGKRDLERVALLNSLGILDMDPASNEGKSIMSLVNMAGSLLRADYVFVSLLDHQYQHVMFPSFRNNQKDGLTKKDLGKIRSVLNHLEMVKTLPDGSGNPFWGQSHRCLAFSNFVIASPGGQSFVVHDVAKDKNFASYKDKLDVGFCSASPIIIQGFVVAALCLACKDARPDYGKAQEIQQEHIAQLIAQQFETWALHQEMKRLEREQSLLLLSHADERASLPEDYAVLVFTGVQGADAMWETNADAMNQALTIHNQIIRQHIAAHSGYEVNTDRDSFQVAFASVADAVHFCLKVQEALYAAPWDEAILALPDASDDAASCFRGLRVRMAIHAGDVVSTTSDVSGRVSYGGKTFHIAKSLLPMCHGGQILVTSDVWNISSQMADSTLGSPQVMDLGSHVLLTQSNNMHDGIVAKNILQLVPASLSHDYFVSRRVPSEGTREEGTLPDSSSHRQGRVFPPVMSKKCLGASFDDAPHGNNSVAMLFVNTAVAEKLVEDPSVLLAALSRRIGTILADNHHLNKGYQSKDFMLAFGDVGDAVRFGLALQEYLKHHRVLDLSLADLVQVGVHEGELTVMGPHPTTGRADYFGVVVNRAALVANIAATGSVYLGKEALDLDESNLLPLSNGYMLDFLGVQSLGGARDQFAVYKCNACNKLV